MGGARPVRAAATASDSSMAAAARSRVAPCRSSRNDQPEISSDATTGISAALPNAPSRDASGTTSAGQPPARRAETASRARRSDADERRVIARK